MIENRHLKKTFILAITASAILSCLTSAQSLHSQIRDRRRQKQMQRQQQETHQVVERLEKEVESGRGRHSRSRSHEEEHVDRMARDLDHQLARSATQIGREYDKNYYYMGQRFAEGDGKILRILLLLS